VVSFTCVAHSFARIFFWLVRDSSAIDYESAENEGAPGLSVFSG
jgi:hypothetical protein